MGLRSRELDDPVAMRRAGPELLSVALIDARNLTLRWLAVFEQRGRLARGDGLPDGPPGGPGALWLAGHAGWYQEWWIARHVQRSRGEQADPAAPRLASVDSRADGWFAGDTPGLGEGPPDADTTRSYLATTLDTTLDLLAGSAADDAALFVYRLALLHEDRLGQALAEAAVRLQLPRRPDPPAPLAALPVRPAREALHLPEARLQLGSPCEGFAPDNECGGEMLKVPAFEIDAQAVSWQRYIEFAEDGGYDQRGCWSDEGWTWQQAHGRRAPRHVEQLRGGALARQGGELQRLPGGQAVAHVSRFEAEAWCRWAGRRLPTEPEWELAALSAGPRGFAWGDVFEWVAGSARGWPGYRLRPGSLDRLPGPGWGVLRGASMQTPARWRHPKARRFLRPAQDHAFCGFRSCAP